MLYYSDQNLTIYQADVAVGLDLLAEKSVHCAVTSPPYWGLRNFEIPPTDWPEITFIPMAGLSPVTVPPMRCVHGLEPDPLSYTAHSVYIFRKLHRVLRDDGTLWLNLGDSYAGSGKASGQKPEHKNCGRIKQKRGYDVSEPTPSYEIGLKPKDLIGIPWRVALALQADGWYLRIDNIWSKNNCMPESVTDRPSRAHEYIFLLSKSQRYYYDAEAVKEQVTTTRPELLSFGPRPQIGYTGHMADRRRIKYPSGWDSKKRSHGRFNQDGRNEIIYNDDMTNGTRNLRSVWQMASQPYKEAHFATFPESLPEKCILAGTSENGVCAKCGAGWVRVVEKHKANIKLTNDTLKVKDVLAGGDQRKPLPRSRTGEEFTWDTKTIGWKPGCKCNAEVIPATVLDPYAGSGTTLSVSERLGRRSIGIELNPEYCKLIKKRCHQIHL